MRAISGVLVPNNASRQYGSASLAFIAVPGEESTVGDTTIYKVTRVYEGDDVIDRPFHSDPAYIVHIREFKIEDRTRGSHGSEIDWFEINSNCSTEELSVSWNAHETGSEIIEIGFMVVGL